MQIVLYDRDVMYHLLSRWCLGKHLQDVAIWYNHQNGYRRTSSMDRFSGRVVEPLPWALAIIAAYLKVDPLRSGQAADPTDCRYCSYATAMGDGRTGIGLGGIPLFHGGRPFFEAIAAYHPCLSVKGADCGERQVVRDLKINRFR